MDLRPPRVFFLSLTAWAAYWLARTMVQDMAPAYDLASYVQQDLLISVLRLGTLLFCLWLGRLAYDKEAWWGGPGRPGLAWGLGIWMGAAFTLSWFARPAAALEGNGWFRGVELGINVLVAVNEEFGWRGVMLLSLRDWLGPRLAVWGTALLFVGMHIGYQPWQAWPRILLFGLTMGFARLAGFSLWQLCAIHAAVDVSLALYFPIGEPSAWTLEIVSAAMVAAAALWAWRAYLAASADSMALETSSDSGLVPGPK